MTAELDTIMPPIIEHFIQQVYKVAALGVKVCADIGEMLETITDRNTFA